MDKKLNNDGGGGGRRAAKQKVVRNHAFQSTPSAQSLIDDAELNAGSFQTKKHLGHSKKLSGNNIQKPHGKNPAKQHGHLREELYSSEVEGRSTPGKMLRKYVSPPASTSTHDQNAAQRVSAMIAAATTQQHDSISSSKKIETPRRFSSQTQIQAVEAKTSVKQPKATVSKKAKAKNQKSAALNKMLEARQQLLQNPLLNINYEDGNSLLLQQASKKTSHAGSAVKGKYVDDEGTLAGWPQLQSTETNHQKLGNKQQILLGPKSAQFYVIHSVKGDSEEQDPVNCANVSDSDESLKLPQLPNWRMSSVKSQAKLFQSIMPLSSQNANNGGVGSRNFHSNLSNGRGQNSSIGKNLSLPPLKKQYYGALITDGVNSGGKVEEETFTNAQSNKNMYQHLSSTTTASLAAHGIPGFVNGQKLQPIYHQQAKKLKALRNVSNHSEEPQTRFLINAQQIAHKNKFSNQFIPPSGDPILNGAPLGSSGRRQKSQFGGKPPSLDKIEIFPMRPLIVDRSPSDSLNPGGVTHIMSLYQSPSEGNTEKHFTGFTKPVKKNHRHSVTQGRIEERKEEESLGNLDIILPQAPESPTYNTGQHQSMNMMSSNRRSDLRSQVMQKHDQSHSQLQIYTQMSNNALPTLDVGTFKTALILSRVGLNKTLKIQFPHSVIVRRNLNREESDLIYMANQSQTLMMCTLEPERDLNGILHSWLTMNLAKSQSGLYVPITISKFESNSTSLMLHTNNNQDNIPPPQKSHIFNFFVVTAKEQFEERISQVSKGGFLMQRYIPQRGQCACVYRVLWHAEKGFKFYLFRSRYSYNGHVVTTEGPELGGDRHFLRGKKFISFEKLARLYKHVSEKNQASQLASQFVDTTAYRSQQHVLLQAEIYDKFSNLDQQFKITIQKGSNGNQRDQSEITSDDFVKQKLKPDTQRQDTPSGGTYRTLINQIQKQMTELIQTLQECSPEQMFHSLGSAIIQGSLKKITADFIEDYQSEVESPLLLLTKIVSITGTPYVATTFANVDTTQDTQGIESLQDEYPQQKSNHQYSCQGDYCNIQRSPFIPRHLAPVLGQLSLSASNREHQKISQLVIQEDRRLLQMIQNGEEYQTAIANSIPLEAGILPNRSNLALELNEVQTNSSILHSQQPLNSQNYRSQNQQLSLAPNGTTRSMIPMSELEPQVEVCSICYQVYVYLQQLKNASPGTGKFYQPALNNSMNQRASNNQSQPFISIRDNKPSEMDKMQASSNQMISQEIRLEQARIGQAENNIMQSGRISAGFIEEINGAGISDMPQLPQKLRQSLFSEGQPRQKTENFGELKNQVIKSYNAPLISIVNNEINFAPRRSLELTEDLLAQATEHLSLLKQKPFIKKSCTIQTFLLDEILPNTHQMTQPPRTSEQKRSSADMLRLIESPNDIQPISSHSQQRPDDNVRGSGSGLATSEVDQIGDLEESKGDPTKTKRSNIIPRPQSVSLLQETPKQSLGKGVVSQNLVASMQIQKPPAFSPSQFDTVKISFSDNPATHALDQESPTYEAIQPRTPPRLMLNGDDVPEEEEQTIKLYMIRSNGRKEEDNILVENDSQKASLHGSGGDFVSLTNSAKKVMNKVFSYQQNAMQIKVSSKSGEAGRATPGVGLPKKATIRLKGDSKIDSFFGRFSEQDDEYLVEYIASINDDSQLFGQSNKSSAETPFQSNSVKNNGGIVLVLSKNHSFMSSPKKQLQLALERHRRLSSKNQPPGSATSDPFLAAAQMQQNALGSLIPKLQSELSNQDALVGEMTPDLQGEALNT